ncbi:hypothetical protein GCM10010198_45870 [Nocardia seriolae]|nr:hypothetical protein NSERKGN1266_58850 [Nocardia seriolae]BEK94231.1 hypothetical protein NSER024013_21370 [Nocardia seriolae]GEM26830.1 hypothetical protein NS2_50690 [Nocardia seriolae NBRC 15557]
MPRRHAATRGVENEGQGGSHNRSSVRIGIFPALTWAGRRYPHPVTEPDPQLDELAEQTALLRGIYGEMDFADVNQQLDRLIAGLDEMGRELDDALSRIREAQQQLGEPPADTT